MKKVSLGIAFLFTCFTFTLTAQEMRGPQQRGQRPAFSQEEMMKRQETMLKDQVAELKKELNLNEEQEKQIHNLLSNNLKKRGELFQKYGRQRDSIMFHSKKMEEAQENSYKKILTADQYKTYVAYKERKMKEMEERRKAWQRGPGGNMRGPQER